MIRYFAFLRAINVGGRTVKMDHLRRLFESFGFSNVETFIASGNVVFETSSRNVPSLEKKIASGLRDALGYDVAAFIRSGSELAAIAEYRAFSRTDLDAAAAFNVAFLAAPPDKAEEKKVMALRTEIDDFKVHGREIYWLCRKMQSKSTFSNAVLEKTLRSSSTLRGMNTMRKLSAKYAAG